MRKKILSFSLICLFLSLSVVGISAASGVYNSSTYKVENKDTYISLTGNTRYSTFVSVRYGVANAAIVSDRNGNSVRQYTGGKTNQVSVLSGTGIYGIAHSHSPSYR